MQGMSIAGETLKDGKHLPLRTLGGLRVGARWRKSQNAAYDSIGRGFESRGNHNFYTASWGIHTSCPSMLGHCQHRLC